MTLEKTVWKRALAATLFAAMALAVIAVPVGGVASAKVEKGAWGIINRADSSGGTTKLV